MGRPAGSKNKPKEEVNEEVKENVLQAKEEEVKEAEKVVESSEKPKETKLEPLGVNQKYFESPEGHIIIGEADKDRVWCRQTNNGKGGWINPKR